VPSVKAGGGDPPDLPTPLPRGLTVSWHPRHAAWLRIYHKDFFTPDALHRRRYGPLHRFDHHTPPAASPANCPEGRTVIYLAADLPTAVAEVFDLPDFGVCPMWRLAYVQTVGATTVQDVFGNGAKQLGTDQALGSGNVTRAFSQRAARHIYTEHPTIQGIHYAGSNQAGKCLALWERAPALKVVQADGGADESALHDAGTWPEIRGACVDIGQSAYMIRSADCTYCEAARDAEAKSIGGP
jgi:hypothetical protein